MAKRKAPDAPLARATEPLYREIRAVLEEARAGVYRAVNAAMVQTYWHIGRLIVEHEQGGAKRAAYGEAVLDDVSRRLTAEFGRGFDVTNLRMMRQFYRMFEIRDAVRLESGGKKRDTLRLAFGVERLRHMTCDELSWSHYRLLMQVENPAAREWYLHEAADQHWSTRQLDRQISALYYERLLGSRKKAPVRKEARDKIAAIEPEQFIRDPYVLENLARKRWEARDANIQRVALEGRATVVMLSLEAHEWREHERQLLMVLARGEREIAEGNGHDLDSVLAEADALIDQGERLERVEGQEPPQ